MTNTSRLMSHADSENPLLVTGHFIWESCSDLPTYNFDQVWKHRYEACNMQLGIVHGG